MKRTQPKLRTKPLHDALLAWDKTSKAHNADVNQRGKAMLDTKRLKLMLEQKKAYIRLNDEFNKWLRL